MKLQESIKNHYQRNNNRSASLQRKRDRSRTPLNLLQNICTTAALLTDDGQTEVLPRRRNGEVTIEQPQIYSLSISQRHARTDLLLLLLLVWSRVGELGWRRGGRKRQVRRNRGDHQHHSPVLWRCRACAMRAKLQTRGINGLCNFARKSNCYQIEKELFCHACC